MKDYKTIPQAIEIAKATYKDHIYTMNVCEEINGEEKVTGVIIGNALFIYSEQLFHNMKKDNISFWPINDNDIEGMALMETIFAVPMDRAPHYRWEFEARDFLNSIVEEAENA